MASDAYSIGPSPHHQRARWLRSGVLLLVCLALGILFIQRFGLPWGGGEDRIGWLTNIDDAMAQSRKSGKPLLVDFTASWCPPCQEMKRRSWPDGKVQEIVRRDFIAVLMDVDRADAKTAAQKYGVEYIPALFVLDSGGNVVRRGSFMSNEELLKFLEGHPG